MEKIWVSGNTEPLKQCWNFLPQNLYVENFPHLKIFSFQWGFLLIAPKSILSDTVGNFVPSIFLDRVKREVIS